MNDPDIKKLPIGSICGHGTAEAIAKLHSILANGGVYQGKQLLSEESINRMQQISSGGIDLAFSMDGMWSVGPMVFPVVESGKPVSILILVYENTKGDNLSVCFKLCNSIYIIQCY